jgi:hypothetical protein
MVFGAFVNAAGMTGPVMMWMHRWHARLGLGSMVPVVTALYAGGLLIIPGILAVACGWVSQRWARRSAAWKDLTCSFTLALVPVGFGMWLAHFSNHLVAGWSTLIPAAERFFSRVPSGGYPQASIPSWLPSLEFLFLGFGLLLTLYSAWRVACRVSRADRMAMAVMSPWAVLASALYAAGLWIVCQPMQMRGMMMH